MSSTKEMWVIPTQVKVTDREVSTFVVDSCNYNDICKDIIANGVARTTLLILTESSFQFIETPDGGGYHNYHKLTKAATSELLNLMKLPGTVKLVYKRKAVTLKQIGELILKQSKRSVHPTVAEKLMNGAEKHFGKAYTDLDKSEKYALVDMLCHRDLDFEKLKYNLVLIGAKFDIHLNNKLIDNVKQEVNARINVSKTLLDLQQADHTMTDEEKFSILEEAKLLDLTLPQALNLTQTRTWDPQVGHYTYNTGIYVDAPTYYSAKGGSTTVVLDTTELQIPDEEYVTLRESIQLYKKHDMLPDGVMICPVCGKLVRVSTETNPIFFEDTRLIDDYSCHCGYMPEHYVDNNLEYLSYSEYMIDYEEAEADEFIDDVDSSIDSEFID